MMRRFLSVRFLLFLVGLSGGLGCDGQKKSTGEKASSKTEPNPKVEVKAEPPQPPRAWHEGAFRGKSKLAPGPDASRRDGSKQESAVDSPESGEPVELELNVTLGSGEFTGRGTFGTEALSLSGISDEKSVRLVLEGGSVRGAWVGQGDEQAGHFKGVVRLSRTQTQGGKVSTESYSGAFLLAPALEQ